MPGFEYSPVTLGQRISEEMYDARLVEEFETNQSDIVEALAIAERLADQHGYLSQDYFIRTARAFAIPRIIEAEEDTSSWGMEGLVFKGNLVTYSMVKVGRLIGGNAIRSVCLAFEDVTMLPGFDKIRPSDRLHVPVYAVSEIDRMAA
jgi:hypothetical protein